MKAFLLTLGLLCSAGLLFAQNPWCISITDACCDGNETVGTYSLGSGANDYVNTFYIHYDSGNKSNKVKIGFSYDGGAIHWTLDNLCGCGNTSKLYPIRGPHTLQFHVQCELCSMPPCDGVNARVWIWTPQTVACALACGNPTDNPGGE